MRLDDHDCLHCPASFFADPGGNPRKNKTHFHDENDAFAACGSGAAAGRGTRERRDRSGRLLDLKGPQDIERNHTQITAGLSTRPAESREAAARYAKKRETVFSGLP
ncbi:hypothetical protein LAZ40_11505 [Cereibacter sphaeroides]|uniref:hypothetical protein n=1 Tax=Cereibacter sphaeroides TaxID=1063 RepID=UPI001F48539B|nr:hypothetical protein [Cereibacter sphaeroides]MCE6959644.1 hypothetical protein [Cereibacter sphaeroides]MCE6974495.1 hypothetical protein [Cereibacter sphaeroides]